MKDPHSRNEKEGMTLDLFARALHALAVRLYPGSKNGADAVNQMLQHCAENCCYSSSLRPINSEDGLKSNKIKNVD